MRQILVDRLESLQQAGVVQLPRLAVATSLESPAATADAPGAVAAGPPMTATTTAPASQLVSPVKVKAAREQSVSAALSACHGSALFDQTDGSSGGEFSDVSSLEILQQTVAGCTRCGELAQTRTQTVFGVGHPNARLCFLGEAPGADEDRLGEPFVGRAGQLLTKIIEACKMQREDVYILNMIKCRPPGNRNPLPTELTNCRGYLERQLDLIQPEFICCCGAVAAQNLLNTTVSIGKLRGKIHEYRGIKVVCTYHPAFLLRSPGFKKETWEDMKFLMREMGTPLE
jgi:DNA polymerase